jgi:hypothetical protein
MLFSAGESRKGRRTPAPLFTSSGFVCPNSYVSTAAFHLNKPDESVFHAMASFET